MAHVRHGSHRPQLASRLQPYNSSAVKSKDHLRLEDIRTVSKSHHKVHFFAPGALDADRLYIYRERERESGGGGTPPSRCDAIDRTKFHERLKDVTSTQQQRFESPTVTDHF